MDISKTKFNWKTLLIIALIIFFFIMLCVWIYKHYFEFNNDLVNSYIDREANKYQDSATVKDLLRDACNSALADKNAVAAVKKLAKVSGVDKEFALVETSLASLKSLGYIQ